MTVQKNKKKYLGKELTKTGLKAFLDSQYRARKIAFLRIRKIHIVEQLPELDGFVLSYAQYLKIPKVFSQCQLPWIVQANLQSRYFSDPFHRECLKIMFLCLDKIYSRVFFFFKSLLAM